MLKEIANCAFIVFVFLAAPDLSYSQVNSLLSEIELEDAPPSQLDRMDQLCERLPVDSLNIGIAWCHKALAGHQGDADHEKQALLHLIKGRFHETLSEPDMARNHYDSALFSATQGNVKRYVARSYHWLSILEFSQGAWDSAASHIDLARAFADSVQLPDILQFMANIELEQGDLDTALALLETAQKMSVRAANNLVQSRIYMHLAAVAEERSDYAASIEYYLKAIELCKTERYPRLESGLANDMGIVYLKMKQWDQALTLFEQAAHLKLALGDSLSLATTFANTGIAQTRLQNYTDALTAFQAAESLKRKLGTTKGLYQLYLNLGFLYQKKGEVSLAERQYFLALEQAKIAGSALNQLSSSIYLSNFYIEQEELQKALQWVEESYQRAQDLKDDAHLRSVYVNLVRVHEKLGNYQTALEYSILFKEHDDSLKEAGHALAVVQLENEYKLKSQANELTSRNKELALLKSQKELSDSRNGILLASLIILFLLSLFLIYSIRRRKSLQILNLDMKNQLLESNHALVQERLKNEQISKAKVESELNTAQQSIRRKSKEYSELEQNLERLQDEKAIELFKESNGVTNTIFNFSQSETNWDSFMEYFRKNYHDFLDRLKMNYPELTPSDLRLCALLKMNLTTKEIASILNITPDSLRKSKYRLRKKINPREKVSLETFLLGF